MKTEKVYLYPSLGGSFSMNRYLKGVQQGLEANNIPWEIVSPSKDGVIAKYIKYPKLAWSSRKKKGKHLIISERYSYLLHFLKDNTIVVCHDLHTLYPQANTPFIHRLFYRFLLFSMRSATKLVCVSNHTKYDLERFSPKVGKGKNVTVVHNGIEEFWINKKNEIGEKPEWFKLFEKRKVLLSVGTDAWYKNNVWTLNFLSQLSNQYHLLRVGDFNSENRRLIEESSLSDRITEVKGVTDEELKYAYSHSSALLFPSISEGFGWPALEAALCGCPVITDRAGAVSEIFRNKEEVIGLDSALDKNLLNNDLQPKPIYKIWADQVKQLIA